MSNESAGQKRDLNLAPNQYLFMQDTGKNAQIKTYKGPINITPGAQEVPIKYERPSKFIEVKDPREAIMTDVVAVEGSYIELENPSKTGEHPKEGTTASMPDLDVGRKVNIHGPAMFSLWAGQSARVIKGHHLRSNQFLLCKVYNEKEARANLNSLVAKPATPSEAQQKESEEQKQHEQKGKPGPKQQQVSPLKDLNPSDLVDGFQFIIRGTETSFFMPPTGISVVRNEGTQGLQPEDFLREAVTLEQLEYAVLIDESGDKRYEMGPQVVFPKPTERFKTTEEEPTFKVGDPIERSFRANELSPLQGIWLKFIADVEFIDNKEKGKKKTYFKGEEVFFKGDVLPIYYPQEGHSIMRYDGKDKHFATLITDGDARYLANRLTGEIALIKGPKMELPDPTTHIFVRRALTDQEVCLFFPGTAGTGSPEALQYNRMLREQAEREPTVRQGVVSENRLQEAQSAYYASNDSGLERSRERGMKSALSNRGVLGGVDVSNQGKNTPTGGIDQIERSSTYTQPRSLTVGEKKGVPTIKVRNGYAVQVVGSQGQRKVVIGPHTHYLEFGETLDPLSLSSGNPKTTDKLFRTAYLNIYNNKVSDTFTIETEDHVTVRLRVSYLVSFINDKEAEKWFSVENYIKLLCDRNRSKMKGIAKKYRIQEFFIQGTPIIRDTLLGVKPENGKRLGFTFEANNMHLQDVEVLSMQIENEEIGKLLQQSQHGAVSSSLTLGTLRRNLEEEIERQKIERKKSEERAETTRAQIVLDMKLDHEKHVYEMRRLEFTKVSKAEEMTKEKLVQQLLDFVDESANARAEKLKHLEVAHQEAVQKLSIEMINAEALALRDGIGSLAPGFNEALIALSNSDTLVKVAEASSIQRLVGGKSFLDFLESFIGSEKLGSILKSISAKTDSGQKLISTPVGNGGSKDTSTRAPA